MRAPAFPDEIRAEGGACWRVGYVAGKMAWLASITSTTRNPQMKKPAVLFVGLILGAAVAGCDRSITVFEGGHTVGSGNMKSAAGPLWDTTTDSTARGGHTVGSGN
jgi:hypothetical protein